MHKKISPVWVLIAIFAVTSLACNIQLTNTPAPSAPPPAADTNTPAAAVPTSVDTQAVVPSQVPTQSTGSTLPSGILVDTGDKYGITLFNAAGQSITELKASNSSGFYTGEALMAGPVAGQILTPLVYLAWNGSRQVVSNVNDTLTVIRQSNDLYQIKSADGQNVIVFVEVSWPSGGSGLDNKVYFGSVESLTGVSTPSFTTNDPDMLAIAPMAVKAVNGQIQGFFYSRMAYGIGGDIVFAPQRGLYFYNAVSATTTQVLSNDRTPVGISPDMTWAASTAYSNYTDLQLHNLDANTSLPLPIESTSDRGAGNLVFSPDNHYIAWMEASGFRMSDTPNFKSLVKIGDNSGQVLFNIPDTAFSSVVGATAQFTDPVGFLDNANFLVQVLTADMNKSYVVKVNVQTGTITSFCSGIFLGFYYP